VSAVERSNHRLTIVAFQIPCGSADDRGRLPDGSQGRPTTFIAMNLMHTQTLFPVLSEFHMKLSLILLLYMLALGQIIIEKIEMI